MPQDELRLISFPTADTGYIAGQNNYSNASPPLLRTVDQGKTWTFIRVYSVGGQYFQQLQFRTGKIALGILSNHEPPASRLVKSTDGGETWVFLTSPFDEQGALGLRFSKNLTWYLWNKAGLLHSSDDGMQWDTVDRVVFWDLGLFDSLPLYRVGTPIWAGENRVMSTKDSGRSWYRQRIDTGFMFYSVAAPSSNVAFAAGTAGTIYKTIDRGGGPLNAVGGNNTPSGFEFSVFPNPSSGLGNIHYKTDRPSRVRLIVTNTLGSIVRTLYDGAVATGNHEIKFDLSNDPSGKYYFGLYVDGYPLVSPLQLTR